MMTQTRPMPMNSSNFGDALQAVAYLKVSPAHAISIKLRPVKWNEDRSQLWDAYVYPGEYAKAFASLDSSTVRKLDEIGMGDRAALFTMPNGEQGLLIEHETGPEVVATIALVTASFGLAKEMFSFFKELLKAINDANEKRKKAGEPIPDRFYAADAVSLEARLQGEPKLVAGLDLPVVDEKVFDRFLQEGVLRLKDGTEWSGFRG